MFSKHFVFVIFEYTFFGSRSETITTQSCLRFLIDISLFYLLRSSVSCYDLRKLILLMPTGFVILCYVIDVLFRNSKRFRILFVG